MTMMSMEDHNIEFKFDFKVEIHIQGKWKPAAKSVRRFV